MYIYNKIHHSSKWGPNPVFWKLKRLRQGDPLSPYFFIWAMETLSRIVLRAREQDFLTGHKVGEEGVWRYPIFCSPTIPLFSVVLIKSS